jgi:hypothetical protein
MNFVTIFSSNQVSGWAAEQIFAHGVNAMCYLLMTHRLNNGYRLTAALQPLKF